MRVNVLIATDTYAPDVNGVSISVQRQRETMENSEWSTEVMGPKRMRVSLPIPTLRLFSSIDPAYKFELPVRSSSILSNIRHYDLVHAHTPFGIGRLAQSVARRNQVPFLYSHHTNFFPDYLHYLGSFNVAPVRTVLRNTYATFLSKCDQIIVPSESAKERFAKQYHGLHNKTSILPSMSFTNDTISLTNLRNRRNIDLTLVGRLAPEKNWDLAIRSINLVLSRNRDARVEILGDGISRASLEASILPDIRNRVNFRGFVTNNEVMQTLLRTKLLLFTSLTDTQAVVLDEAHACGVPVVALDSPLAQERINDNYNGWVGSNDPKSFSRTIEIALSTYGERSKALVKNCRRTLRYQSPSDWLIEYHRIITEKVRI